MSVLRLTTEFIATLSSRKSWENVLKLYGMPTKKAFYDCIINRLNAAYPWLGVEKVLPMPAQKEKEYNMYNGYVEGFDNLEYDEVLVSFSELYTKEGNTVISQQLMPVLQNKLRKDPAYLYDHRVKRIFLLTSHKSQLFEQDKNKIKKDKKGSTLQMLVKCLNTLGFHVLPIIPVVGLDTGARFENIHEFIETLNYITANKAINAQHEQIRFEGNTVIGSFDEPPKGQEEKYFALRFLTAIALNQGYFYDVTQPLKLSGESEQMRTLAEVADYVNRQVPIEIGTPISEHALYALFMGEEAYQKRLEGLAKRYGEEGVSERKQKARLTQVQQAFRNTLIEHLGQKCLLCEITNLDMLVASHIKDSAVCNIYEKADKENGFLLCGNHDKLFDRHLITFDADTGEMMISQALTAIEKTICGLDENYRLPADLMTEKRKGYLQYHNEKYREKNK